MATPDEPRRIRTVDATTLWRRIAKDKNLAPEPGYNRADRQLGLELMELAGALYRTLAERIRRVTTLGGVERAVDILLTAGYTWEDTGLPELLPYPNLPEDLDEAYALRAWLEAHPSKLPPVAA